MAIRCFTMLSALCMAVLSAATHNICLIGTTGWVNCDAGKDPASFSGFDVELFRLAASRAGWTEDKMAMNMDMDSDMDSDKFVYKFVCHSHNAGWSALANLLVKDDTMSECACASGAFALTSTRMRTGVRFSYPYYRTGLGVVIKTGGKLIDIWAFFRPFTVELWISFLITIVVVPLLAFVTEQLMLRGVLFINMDTLKEAHQATYNSILAVFNLKVYNVKSFASQLTIVVFCFLVMITMATYVANLAAALAIVGFDIRYSHITSLRGRAVASHSSYSSILMSAYGIPAKYLDFDGMDTWVDVNRALVNGTLDAYVMDLPEIGYYIMNHNDNCAVRLLPEKYGSLDFGYLFHKDFPSDALDTFNTALFDTIENNQVEEMGNKYLLFLGALSKCTHASDTDAVQFMQLAGLWILQGAALGFAIVSCIVAIAWRMIRHDNPDNRKLSSIFVRAPSHGSLASQPSLNQISERDAVSAVPRRLQRPSNAVQPFTHHEPVKVVDCDVGTPI
jgi:ABC-type amino acid transport substrate-binding protein